MKKFVVSLVSIVTLLVPTQVLAENWVQVSGQLDVDTDSIAVNRRDSNIRVYWERFQPNRPGYLMIRRIANCATGRTKELEVVVHNNVGRVVDRKSFDFNDRGGQYTRPGSLGSRVLNIVCR